VNGYQTSVSRETTGADITKIISFLLLLLLLEHCTTD
jgi:hypothetical protein